MSWKYKKQLAWCGFLTTLGLSLFFGLEPSSTPHAVPTAAYQATEAGESKRQTSPETSEPTKALLEGPSASLAIASSPTEAAPPEATRSSSLRGTSPDGEITLNPDGTVRLNLEVRRLFDYYLSRAGEMSEAELAQWIDEQFSQSYPPAVAQQLRLLLDQYRGYQRELARATPRLSRLKDGDRLTAIIELRRQFLGETLANAFFADEQAWDQFCQARRSLAGETAISELERNQREQELLQQLPPLLAQAYLDQKSLDARLAGALPNDAAQRNAVRERQFGPEAAARFAALDQSRNEFEGRVQNYLNARAQLAGNNGAERDRLRLRFFSASEASRVAALEAIGQESALFTPP